MLPKYLNQSLEKIFQQTYNEVLSSQLSRKEHYDTIDLNYAIYNAALIALNTIDILYERDGRIKSLDKVVNYFNQRRLDTVLTFPAVAQSYD